MRQLLIQVQLFVTPWIISRHAPWSIEFSWQEHRHGFPFPSPGDLPNPGIEPGSPASQADSLLSEPPVQFSSVTQLCPSLCDPMNYSTPGLPVHYQLPELSKPMSIELVMPSNHLILCHPLLLLPSIFPSVRVFSSESALCIRWPKYWSFSFSISPSNEHSGLISFRIDWLDFLAVQGTLKSLLQHHSSKASILQHSAFFIVQLSHPYMTTGKTIALTRWTFAGKVMSLLVNMLSRLVITFLPRSKCLLISWLQSPSAVILEPRKIKSATVSTVTPSICHEVMGPDEPPGKPLNLALFILFIVFC